MERRVAATITSRNVACANQRADGQEADRASTRVRHAPAVWSAPVVQQNDETVMPARPRGSGCRPFEQDQAKASSHEENAAGQVVTMPACRNGSVAPARRYPGGPSHPESCRPRWLGERHVVRPWRRPDSWA